MTLKISIKNIFKVSNKISFSRSVVKLFSRSVVLFPYMQLTFSNKGNIQKFTFLVFQQFFISIFNYQLSIFSELLQEGYIVLANRFTFSRRVWTHWEVKQLDSPRKTGSSSQNSRVKPRIDDPGQSVEGVRRKETKTNSRRSVLDTSNSSKYCTGVVFTCSVMFNTAYLWTSSRLYRIQTGNSDVPVV